MPDAPRLFFSVGDTSGDHHAARLLLRLRELVPDLQAEGLGGPALAAAGCPLHEDLVQQSIFGFAGAVKAIPHLLGVLGRTAGVLDARRPDAVIIVDYPGLNLYVARLAARRGIPVIYFVAPQLWAWAPWRARRFARVIDEALVIFPFEVAFWREAGVEAHDIGHPLLDGLPRDEAGRAAARDPAITALPRPVALLPGSRAREVRDLFPPMLGAAKELLRKYPDASFHAAHVSPVERENLAAHARAAGVPLTVHGDRVHAVMASCRCAIVGSGTATLETALFGTPLVIVYQISRSASRFGWLVVAPFYGQANLLLGRVVAPELIFIEGETDREARLVAATEPLMTDTAEWRGQREAFEALRARQPRESAIERAAQLIVPRLRTSVRSG